MDPLTTILYTYSSFLVIFIWGALLQTLSLTSKNDPWVFNSIRTAVIGIHKIEQQAMLQPRPFAQMGYSFPS